MTTDETNITGGTTKTPSKSGSPAPPTGSQITGAREPGFRADGTAYPGVDPDTGERKAVTWDGLREEFGVRKGSKLYNDIAVAAFGGVPSGRNALSLATLDEAHAREGLDADRAAKRASRREKVLRLLAEAEKE